MLLANEILHKSDEYGERNIIRITAEATKLSQTELFIRTYTKKLDVGDDTFPTYLSVVPAKICSVRPFLTTAGSREESQSMQFATKLDGHTNLSVEDMTLL